MCIRFTWGAVFLPCLLVLYEYEQETYLEVRKKFCDKNLRWSEIATVVHELPDIETHGT